MPTKTNNKETEAPKYTKVGENIKAKVVDDVLFLKIRLNVDGKLSQRGGAYILAQTNRFASLEEIVGEPVGLSLVVTKKREKSKPKRKRDDDDE